MCAAFSCAANPSIRLGSGGNILPHNCRRKAARSKLTIAATLQERTDQSGLHELSLQGLPHLNQRIYDIMQRQSQPNFDSLAMNGASRKPQFDPVYLEEAYQGCRKICAEDSKMFYLGTLLMPKERQKSIWAIYVWCRRVDEVVDGPDAVNVSSGVLDEWEARLEDIFSGRPHDMLDAAFTDTISKFPLDIQPYKDMIEGMKMDTYKKRYANFQELYLYCYYVAGTVALMSMPIFGIEPESSLPAETIYNSGLAFAIGNQLTNILRDVSEDADRGRVYLPQDELARFGLSDEDIFSRRVTDNWRVFIKAQIERARYFFDLAEAGASQLHKASRWPVWSTIMMYRMILDEIENNNYDNLTKRAKVGGTKRLMALPLAYFRAQQFRPANA